MIGNGIAAPRCCPNILHPVRELRCDCNHRSMSPRTRPPDTAGRATAALIASKPTVIRPFPTSERASCSPCGSRSETVYRAASKKTIQGQKIFRIRADHVVFGVVYFPSAQFWRRICSSMGHLNVARSSVREIFIKLAWKGKT
jgi:hypothetical protein